MSYKRAWKKLYEYHNGDRWREDSQHDWEMRELMDEILREVVKEVWVEEQ
tara:strand:+ start:2408 stop:2557 length:150 start_codon:yes stop_codon:yes gene_type:complete